MVSHRSLEDSTELKYYTVKYMNPRKDGKTRRKFTKIAGDLLHTNAHHHAKFHRDWSNDVGWGLMALLTQIMSYRACKLKSNNI